MVHVEDICQAFAAALVAPRDAVHNQAFNIGRTDENYRVSELAEIVRQTIPGSVIEYAAGGGPDLRCYRVNCDKFSRHVTGFRPQWNVRRGVEQLAAAFCQAPLTSQDIAERRFLRLPNIRKLIDGGNLDADLRRHVPDSAPAPVATEACSV